MSLPTTMEAQIRAESPSEPPKTHEKKPWHRQDGESALWYRRFTIYRTLGPKRSLEAAVLKDQQSIRALKSIKDAPLSVPGKKVRAERGHSDGRVPLAEVANPRLVQVPGSWRAACVKWQWVERVHAWDARCVDLIVEQQLDESLSGLATKVQRIVALKSVALLLAEQINARKGMTYETLVGLVARLQSVLRDIREEMRTFDEAVSRVSLRRQAAKLYTNIESDAYEGLMAGEEINLLTGKLKCDEQKANSAGLGEGCR